MSVNYNWIPMALIPNDGYTPLDYAIIEKKDDIVALLVEKGATANDHFQDEDGEWKRN